MQYRLPGCRASDNMKLQKIHGERERERGKLSGGIKNFRYRKYIRKYARTHIGEPSEDAMISAHDKSR